ncbi:hypothetical protein ASD78_12100 [Lysobacter sp. Root667]|nr:hypothetical protein ASD78_12100 [Lysobacter sp. Root667]
MGCAVICANEARAARVSQCGPLRHGDRGLRTFRSAHAIARSRSVVVAVRWLMPLPPAGP